MPAQKSSGAKAVEFPEDSVILISEILNVSGGNVFGGSYDVLIPAKVRGRGKGGRGWAEERVARFWGKCG